MGVDFIKEAASVVGTEDSGVAPQLVRKRAQIDSLDDEHVARLGAGHLERSG